MEYRQLGRTGMKVSAISFGAWAIGGTWGPVDDDESMRALHAAVDAGTNFVDTADVYGDGRSERLVARLRRERKGETFSGVPYDVGLEAVERLRPLVPAGATLAQLALRWTLMFEAVSCAIPGAKTPRQARENAAAADLPPLSPETMAAVKAVYDDRLRPLVHSGW